MSLKFDSRTTGTEVARALRDQIQGKCVLITGASPGSLGEAAALAIARSAPRLLILASRTPGKLDAVRAAVEKACPSTSSPASATHPAAGRATLAAHGSGATAVETVVVDLSALQSVRQAARQVAALTSRLDVLIHAAGVSLQERQLSPDGFEATLATNHLGPFLLTRLLLPLLLEAARHGAPGATRVVTVSSEAHRLSPFRFADYDLEGTDVPPDQAPRAGLPEWWYATNDGFAGNVAYAMSKCANVLFTAALKERYRREGIESFAVDPGVVRTGLMRDIAPGFRDYLESTSPGTWQSHDQGCAVILIGAFEPTLSGSGAVYLQENRISRPARHASDKTTADKLWNLSEQLTNSVESSRL